ncbi:hypothetical protein HPP92_015188 [Vanilla planifolia]|uniref:LOB domain-containing protein n=1 Tax=Vanilla planifolia TaxID=51239 RepID=A0A835QVE7_VANPL|nr:hypothetical protein HPP92_015188 [Vanilla planifolia]
MAEEIQEMVCRKGGSNNAAASPCAACKLLRRRCVQGLHICTMFPGRCTAKVCQCALRSSGNNAGKLLQEVNKARRSDTARSLVYEANARIELLKAQLALAQAEIVHLDLQHAAYLACCNKAATPLSLDPASSEVYTENLNAVQLFSLEMVLDYASNAPGGTVGKP